jgi:hypothetical protein
MTYIMSSGSRGGGEEEENEVKEETAKVLQIPQNLFLAYFPYFEKIKVNLSEFHAVCVPVIPFLYF